MRYNLLAVAILLSVCSCKNIDKEVEKSNPKLKEQTQPQITNINFEVGDSRGALIPAYSQTFERNLNRINFEDSIYSLYQAVGLKEMNLDYEPFRYAMIGFYSLKQDGLLNTKDLISIIDFTQTSTEKRFYTIDLAKKKVLFNTLVSHGRTTGGNKSSVFSNKSGSNASSLGFYLTAETYVGSKGYSMRLDGLDKGYNDQMRKRAVVMHNAKYVSDDWIKKYGRLGRSQGCPALPVEISKKVIDVIKDRTVIFAYYKDDGYLKSSKYLNLEKLMEKLESQHKALTSM